MTMIKTRDGHDLYYKDWGSGPAVVLIHGWPLSSDSWDSVALSLAENGFRAIAYDRRGFGRSDQPFDGYDYDSLADDLADVMEQTNAGNGVTLVGFSMGGGEVARYFSRHQGRGVKAAVLVSSVVPYMLQTEDNPDGVPEAELEKIAQAVEADRASFFTSFFKQFYGVGLLSKPVSDAARQASWDTAMSAGLHPTLACARAFGFTDFRPDLSSINVPTLVIHGTSDTIVPPALGELAAQKIKGAQYLEYPREPHGLFLTATERLKRDLLIFLRTGRVDTGDVG